MNRVVREGLVVGFGASFGALVRFALTPLMASHPPAELLVTLGINIVGCFLMGLFDPPEFWGKGFLGGLTTFSAVSLASMQSSALFAAVYMFGTLAVAIVAWLLGDALRNRAGAPA
ncbi:CrcB family protein [Corynebacterium genitalium ATCC 33030]|mgnify:FL=1|uniref:Fluoride-specific ion channel FluC n=1 Tax=Corynebacterium genitalium ATCC 33030 TaxID=585529 RepID=D7WBU4_9CORY|nr:CrcB family protein [Corynebacterium genitalium]EFK54573.1 CrcB-like protein [Corynebacterium genitalium ATCC 33030]UUA89090.1 CrcB family protein [Corynebacterium genitalium ATCC 33030]